ncbi:exostosin-like protein [Cladochytrium replicatum]|nr:exostosin-like protein [Cladochytrium replicatum]
MYHMEYLFPSLIRTYLTPLARARLADNPKIADWFLIPHSATCTYHRCVHDPSRNATTDECKLEAGEHVRAILDHVLTAHAFWNRSGGTDHLFVFAWDQASEVLGWSHPVRARVMKAVHLTTLGSVEPNGNFDPHKDVVIPPYNDIPPSARHRFSSLPRFLQWIPVQIFPSWVHSKRSMFAYFRGTILSDRRYSHGVRQFLKTLALVNREFKVFTGHSKDYWAELGDAVFSLCPSGWSSWSPRVFDSIFAGAIPVIYGDGIVMPFEDLLDYRIVAVKLMNKQVSDTSRILNSLTPHEIRIKRENLHKIRDMVVWNDPPKPGDAFESTLKMLARKKARRRIGNDHFR